MSSKESYCNYAPSERNGRILVGVVVGTIVLGAAAIVAPFLMKDNHGADTSQKDRLEMNEDAARAAMLGVAINNLRNTAHAARRAGDVIGCEVATAHLYEIDPTWALLIECEPFAAK